MNMMKKTARFVVYLFVLAGLIALFVYFYRFGYGAFSNEPIGSNEKYKVTVTVRPGESEKEVANQLYTMNMIRDPKQFLFRTRFSEYDGKLKEGEYEISPSMGMDDILKVLTKTEEAK
ncbi:MAG: endolytic transglycosylase MltG [Lachnospiraceae bacterium]|nr:endolytic transglycosylase MltG [Lachnospiraceae bacterium]